MMKTIARRRLEAFEREWNYDAAYMHEILDAGGLEALMAVANLDKISNYRRDIPLEPSFVAKLAAVRAGDCGPCTQLVATMAERVGVDPAAMRAVLELQIPTRFPQTRASHMNSRRRRWRTSRRPACFASRSSRAGERAGWISLAYAIAAAEHLSHVEVRARATDERACS